MNLVYSAGGVPVPQAFSDAINNFEILKSDNSGLHVVLYGPDGNPLLTAANTARTISTPVLPVQHVDNTGKVSPAGDAVGNAPFVKVGDGTDTMAVNTDGSVNTVNLGATSITAALATVTTAGTRVQLPNISCREITLIAQRENTEYIYVGGSDVSSTVYGVELAAKDSITLAVSNANLIYIDSSVNGEGISYVAI